MDFETRSPQSRKVQKGDRPSFLSSLAPGFAQCRTKSSFKRSGTFSGCGEHRHTCFVAYLALTQVGPQDLDYAVRATPSGGWRVHLYTCAGVCLVSGLSQLGTQVRVLAMEARRACRSIKSRQAGLLDCSPLTISVCVLEHVL